MAVNNAAPTIDQMIGYLIPPASKENKSGKLNSRARIVPMYAPMNPTTIEIMQPPFLKPTSVLPMLPVIAAIINRIIMSSILTSNNLYQKISFITEKIL